jgi:hypothetical protein
MNESHRRCEWRELTPFSTNAWRAVVRVPESAGQVGPWQAIGLSPISDRVGYRSFSLIYRAEAKKVEALGCRKSKRLLAS